MILSKNDIQREIGYGDLHADRGNGENLAVEPSSIDVHLGEKIKYPTFGGIVDVADEETYPDWHEADVEGMVIGSGEFLIGTTEETIDLPPDMVGVCHGRSSVGRLGLFVHNAGFIDAGFEGQLTLELYNAAPYRLRLHPGMKIAQIALHRHESTPSVAYSEENGNKYQRQSGPTPSKLYEDF